MKNYGFKIEEQVIEVLRNKKELLIDGKIVQIKDIRTFGHSTRTKVDISINNTYRLQLKTVKSNRATVVNRVPLRNWEKLGKREMLDIQPVMEAINKHSQLQKNTIPLKELADNKEDWREIINYFLFEGTATGSADNFFQANYLLDVEGKEWEIIPKKEAFDRIWENLYFEIRTRAGEETVNIRYG